MTHSRPESVVTTKGPWLSDILITKGVSLVEEREFRRYRRLYRTNRQIRQTVSPELHQRLLGPLVAGHVGKTKDGDSPIIPSWKGVDRQTVF